MANALEPQDAQNIRQPALAAVPPHRIERLAILDRRVLVVGGNGERRTLRIAAELGDACNLTTSDPRVLELKVAVLRAQGREVISLCAGEPSQGAPSEVRRRAAELMIDRTPCARATAVASRMYSNCTVGSL